MNCPNCGYVMAAFDTKCRNCQANGRAAKSCSHCGTVNDIANCDCKKCGRAVVEAVPSELAQETAGILCCPQCGSVDRLPMPSASRTNSALLPPPCPVFRPSHVGSVLVTLIGYPLSLTALAVGPALAGAGILLTSALWFYILVGESQVEAQGRVSHREAYARWEQNMQVWNRSLWCRGCHHVYNQSPANTAPPPAQYLPAIPSRSHAALYVVGTAGVFLLLLCAITLGLGQQRQDYLLRMRAALAARSQDEMPQTQAAIAAGESAIAANIGTNGAAKNDLGSLPKDLTDLKERRDSAKLKLEQITLLTSPARMSVAAAQMTEDLSRIESDRLAVTRDIQALNAPVVLASPPANASPGEAPGSAYGIVTKAGGGAPPNPYALPQ